MPSVTKVVVFRKGERVKLNDDKSHLYDHLGNGEVLRVENATDQVMEGHDKDGPAIYLVAEKTGVHCVAPARWIHHV